jgi:hypothetical protein
MPLIRTWTPSGVNYRQEPLDPDKPVVMTGPVRGPVKLVDGTVYDVSDDYIEVASVAHAGELSHHIGIRHEVEGHPVHKPRDFTPTAEDPLPYNPLVDEFHHACTEHCDAGPQLSRTPAEVEDAFKARLHALGYGHLVGTEEHLEKLDHLGVLRERANATGSYDEAAAQHASEG